MPNLFEGGITLWAARNESQLLALNFICTFVLFLCFILTATISVLPAEASMAMLVGSLVPVGMILLSLIPKGVVPIAISVLGVVLIHTAIMLPYYSSLETGEDIMNGQAFSRSIYPDGNVFLASVRNLALGVAMTVLATILGYRPSALFTRNRPAPSDDEWSRYPVWHGTGSVLADGRSEGMVPVKDIMTEVDRRLLWRYESVLALIYGVLQLVKPEASVPADSTELLRDRASGRLMGKARYTGMFF